ncbi:hypothetical protein V5799_020719 [Amblyomma americanum]|uniref:Uncharacterized protein n=1 Tax=Amblyomma americanum TaxID=6943 RepID=A0AAQ4ET70_AMBAM
MINLQQYKCFKSTFVTNVGGEGQPRMVHYDKKIAQDQWKWTRVRIRMKVLQDGQQIGLTDVVPQKAYGTILCYTLSRKLCPQ